MNRNEINEEKGGSNAAEPKPLKKLVRVNREAAVPQQQYHTQQETAAAAVRHKKAPAKQNSKWVDILVKVLTITVTLIIMLLLIFNMPIVKYKDSSGSKKVSLMYYIRNNKWLGHIEGVIDKTTFDPQINPDINHAEINDGLDLDQRIEGQFSVLVLGFDEDVTNTDIIWVLEFDILAAKLNILQIPRDTCLPDFTNSPNGKFNSIYHNGKIKSGTPKIQGVVEAVQQNFGIPIDAYVTMTCNDIKYMVDLVGGIPIHLDNKIIYEAEKVIPAGDTVLNGEQAEWFMRFRHEWLQGDVGRIQNQRRFMAAAMRKLINIASGADGHNQFYKYLKTIKDNEWIATDLSINDLTKIADFAGTLKMENVRVNMVPGEESDPLRYNGELVYSVHKAATIAMLNKYFRPYQRPMTPSDTAIVEFITNYKHNILDDTYATFDDLENSTEPLRDPNKKPEWNDE